MLRIARTSLVKTLKKVVAFIPKIKTSDTAGVIAMLPEGDDLRIILSYPEATIESVCPIVEVVSPEQPMTMAGSKLLSVVSACDVEVRLSRDDTSLDIVSGQSKWTTPMPKAKVDRINLPDGDGVTFDVYPLLTAMSSVKYAVDSETVRPSLFMIDVVDGRVRACNGFQYREVATGIKGLTFSVPGGMTDSFLAVLRYFDGDVRFYSDDNNYYFVNNSDTIAVRRTALKFPDLDRILVRPLKTAAPSLLQVDKGTLERALKKVKLSIDDRFPYVELHISKKEVLLRGRDKSGSEAVSSIPAKWDLQPRIATFNVSHLTQTLGSLHDGAIEIRFGEDTKARKSPMVIEGEGTWTMLNQTNLASKGR